MTVVLQSYNFSFYVLCSPRTVCIGHRPFGVAVEFVRCVLAACGPRLSCTVWPQSGDLGVVLIHNGLCILSSVKSSNIVASHNAPVVGLPGGKCVAKIVSCGTLRL